MDWLGVFLLAYVTRGVSKLHTDFTAHPVDKPSYARERKVRHSIAAVMLWWNRQPLSSILIHLAYTFAILAAAYWLLGLFTQSSLVRLSVLAMMPAVILFSALTYRR